MTPSSSNRLAWSLLAQSQRLQLEGVASRLGIKLIFLKAVWADEVLFGGVGTRIGGDIDVLVEPSRFHQFAAALEGEGYTRMVSSSHRVTSDYGDKEWAFKKSGAFLPIDLHRTISDQFRSATHGFIARAKAYQTATGSILSLEEEDQVLYCVMHYIGHMFFLDGRHLGDVARLLQTVPLDWGVIRSRARTLGLTVAMALLSEALHGIGADVPDVGFFLENPKLVAAHQWAKTWVSTTGGLSRKQPQSQSKTQLYVDLLYRVPRLKGRPQDAAWVAARYLALRLGDCVKALAAR